MGLESNMTATAPDDLVMNNGESDDVELESVFGGGTGGFTYTAVSADDATATTSIAGNKLTVTGAGVGSTVVTMTAVDELNDSRTTQVTVVVNPVFVGGVIADATLNLGGDNTTYIVDLATVFTGGTPPDTYVVSSDNPGTTTQALAGDMLTVTATALGVANLKVTATDGTGAEASSSFEVTVNAAIVGSPIADEALRENESTVVDLDAVFAGGDGDYTFSMESADDTHVVADFTGTGNEVKVAAIEAYAAGTTIGTVAVTFTATDGLGDTATASITIDVLPVIGDLDGFGGPTPNSASITLDYYLGLVTLTPKQVDAADMNRDATVTHFDAFLNFEAFFSKGEVAEFVSSRIEFGEVQNESNLVTVPVVIAGGDLNEVGSLGLSALIDPALATVVGVESNLGEGWLVGHSVTEDGEFKLGVAGQGEMNPDGVVATITLALTDGASTLSLSAEGSVNNNAVSSIDEVEIAELPDAFTLDGNYPNPFNPCTTIQFSLPESADVEIQVFDMLGRRVMAIPAQTIQAGSNRSVQLNAGQLASGSYLYRVIARMDSKTQVEQGRMMLLK
jgi:hypothetical protein